MVEPAGAGQRREQIIAVSAELFAERGAAATSMRDIGKASGILGGSLYHHFASKDELIDTLTRRAVDDLSQWYADALARSSDPLKQLEGVIEASFRAIERHPAAIRLYLSDQPYLSARPMFAYLADLTVAHEQLWIGIVEAGRRSGVFRQEVHSARFCRVARDTIWSIGRWWPANPAEQLEDIVEDLTSLLLHGLVRSAA